MIRIPLQQFYPSLGIATAPEVFAVYEPSRRELSLTKNQTTPEIPGLGYHQEGGEYVHPNDGERAVITAPLNMFYPPLGIALAPEAFAVSESTVETPILTYEQRMVSALVEAAGMKVLYFKTKGDCTVVYFCKHFLAASVEYVTGIDRCVSNILLDTFKWIAKCLSERHQADSGMTYIPESKKHAAQLETTRVGYFVPAGIGERHLEFCETTIGQESNDE
jgi:hypothetical protein